MNKFRNFPMLVFVVLVVSAVQAISALSGSTALSATIGDTTRLTSRRPHRLPKLRTLTALFSGGIDTGI